MLDVNRVESPGVTHCLSNPGAELRASTEGLECVFAALETREPAEGRAAVACMFNQGCNKWCEAFAEL